MGSAAAANPRSLYALRFCMVSLGIPFEIVRDSAAADFWYGVDGAEARDPRAATSVPYWPECYDAHEEHMRLADPDGTARWVPRGRRQDPPIDLIGGIARLLTMLDESQVAERERGPGGRFLVRSLPAERRASQAEPLVDWHVQAVGRSLRDAGVQREALPRWPGTYRSAVVLTHDVDSAQLHNVRELARVAFRGVRYRSLPTLALASSAAMGWLRGNDDPFFKFGSWEELEASMGVRSAFFVHVGSSAPRHLNDPTYRVSRANHWAILRHLIDEGWEIGVHASIGAHKAGSFLFEERNRLSRLVDHEVDGLRHHYWLLDWREPSNTFAHHQAAGYTYDASIAWIDAPGFRAGTCLPYQPFDPASASHFGLLEIPTTIMDGHLFDRLSLSPEEARIRIQGLMATVAAVGGVLNLNWHQETYANRFRNAGWRSVYESTVQSVVEDPSVWVTTPGQLADWWLARSARVDRPSDS